MAVKAQDETNFLDLSGGRIISMVMKETKADWIVLPYKGIIPVACENITGAPETLTRPTLQVHNAGTAYTAGSLSVVYDNGVALTRPAKDFYVQTVSGEIILVGSDSGFETTTGTLTIKQRACLGTTASATGLANDNYLYLLGSLYLGSDVTGPVNLIYVPLPEDPGVSLY